MGITTPEIKVSLTILPVAKNFRLRENRLGSF